MVAHRITPEGYGPNSDMATHPHSQSMPKGEDKRKWDVTKLTMLYSYVTFRQRGSPLGKVGISVELTADVAWSCGGRGRGLDSAKVNKMVAMPFVARDETHVGHDLE